MFKIFRFWNVFFRKFVSKRIQNEREINISELLYTLRIQYEILQGNIFTN